jgi:hypothetical protein
MGELSVLTPVDGHKEALEEDDNPLAKLFDKLITPFCFLQKR